MDFFIPFVPETTSLQAEGRLDADVYLPFSSYSYMKLQSSANPCTVLAVKQHVCTLISQLNYRREEKL